VYGAVHSLLEVVGQKNRVGHFVGCTEHPRPRTTLEGWPPCLRSALVVFVVGIELESRNIVTIFVKSKIVNFVCRIRKLVR